ncbi:hypothetical protein MJ561_14180 [Klebsiella pneumoniae]|nr:hypothetical protein MJ561_14180 [Klebsiella pneumoniae]
MSERNPFSVSTLPYRGAPPFDVIDDGHYRPAFDEGASGSSQAEIRAIIDNPQPAGFRQHARERWSKWSAAGAGDAGLFAMAGAHTNPYIQSLDEQFFRRTRRAGE